MLRIKRYRELVLRYESILVIATKKNISFAAIAIDDLNVSRIVFRKPTSGISRNSAVPRLGHNPPPYGLSKTGRITANFAHCSP